MKNLIIAVMVLYALMGCAPRNTLYQQWGNKLSEMSGPKGGTKEDVSLLLGARPSRCETVGSQKPVIGIFFEKDKKTIRTVRPQSPADKAGVTL